MRLPSLLFATVMLVPIPLAAQGFPTRDATLEQMWRVGMDQSQADALIQTLTDSIGPRLTGSPGIVAGQAWLESLYQGWGIPSRAEQYGTWLGWRRGTTHIDLVGPRVRSLEGMMLAWSPGTGGRPVTGDVIQLPDLPDSAAYAAWLPFVRGKFVLLSQPMRSCRPDDSFQSSARSETYDDMIQERNTGRQNWGNRVRKTGFTTRTLPVLLEEAGAAGILTSLWSGGWGVTRIFQARTGKVPTLELSCEDYGLLSRLAERGQLPRLQVTADAEFLGEVPVFNVVAEMRGSELPDEYVMLSAHFDSWDGSSGATDNGTGTVTMLEAMRILKATYPNPRRTILVGHWSGEEQGLNGSLAFAEDHPEIVGGLQALFNQDNGTGRVVNMSASGLTGASARIASWVARLPSELSREINLSLPGNPAGGGSDHSSFLCHGAPGFGLGALRWDYGRYTWHTNRDTYDKVVADELKANATLTAMLAFMASEEAGPTPRVQRIVGPGRDGAPRSWPTCRTPARSSGQSTR